MSPTLSPASRPFIVRSKISDPKAGGWIRLNRAPRRARRSLGRRHRDDDRLELRVQRLEHDLVVLPECASDGSLLAAVALDRVGAAVVRIVDRPVLDEQNSSTRPPSTGLANRHAPSAMRAPSSGRARAGRTCRSGSASRRSDWPSRPVDGLADAQYPPPPAACRSARRASSAPRKRQRWLAGGDRLTTPASWGLLPSAAASSSALFSVCSTDEGVVRTRQSAWCGTRRSAAHPAVEQWGTCRG